MNLTYGFELSFKKLDKNSCHVCYFFIVIFYFDRIIFLHNKGVLVVPNPLIWIKDIISKGGNPAPK